MRKLAVMLLTLFISNLFLDNINVSALFIERQYIRNVNEFNMNYETEDNNLEITNGAIYNFIPTKDKSYEVRNNTNQEVIVDNNSQYNFTFEMVHYKADGSLKSVDINEYGQVKIQPGERIQVGNENTTGIKFGVPYELLGKGLEVKELENEAVYRFTTAKDKSYEVRNNTDQEVIVDNNSQYNFTFEMVHYNADGSLKIVDMNEYGQVKIKPGERIQVSNESTTEIKCGVPYELLSKGLEVKELENTVLYSFTITKDKSYEVRNNTDQEVIVDNNSQYNFTFEMVHYKADGSLKIVDMNEYGQVKIKPGERIQVGNENTTEIKCGVPYELLSKGLEVKELENTALYSFTITKDKSYEVRNNTDQEVIVDNNSQYNFTFEMVHYKADGSLKSVDMNEYGQVKIKPGERIQVSNESTTEIKCGVPYELLGKGLEVKELENTALYSFTITKDKSYEVRNNTNQEVIVDNNSQYNFTFEMVHYNADGSLKSVNMNEYGQVKIKPGERIQVSNESTTEIKFGVPYELLAKGLEIKCLNVNNVNYDLNEDGVVDILDLSILALKYNKAVNSDTWLIKLDLNKDNFIDIFDLVILSNNIDKDSDKDSDKDGVPDYLEDYFGCDKNSIDTDSDGLKDNDEIFVLHTDPTLVDSDNNGIKDGDEDVDTDGISNLEEYMYKTSPVKVDTDGDGLKDGDEVKVYKTNPTLLDTDSDGLSDGDEIKLGLDPLKKSTDGKIVDSERKFNQTLAKESIDERLLVDNLLIPTLSGEVSGIIDKNISIQAVNNDAFSENRAIIGSVISIENLYDKNMNFKLTFDYTDLLRENNEEYLEDLVICSYNDTGLITYETIRSESEKTITANISNGGTFLVIKLGDFLKGVGIDVLKEVSIEESLITTLNNSDIDKHDNETRLKSNNEVNEEWYNNNYILIDKDGNEVDFSNNEFDKNMINNSEYTIKLKDSDSEYVGERNRASYLDIKGQADIVFVVDSTESMTDTINNVARNINTFVDRLTSEYNVQANFALVDFKDITEDGKESTKIIKNGISNWFSDVTDFKNKVSSIYVSGGGDYEETDIDALEVARNLDYRSFSNKFIILVTDADYKIDNNYGIKSMSEMAQKLAESKIVTSVVTTDSERNSYKELIESTGGIYANIYGNFSSELLVLADKIGEIVNDGSWVLLNDFQYIKLGGEVSAESNIDTDGDGRTDYEELGTLETIDLTNEIKALCYMWGIPYELYKGKTSISVYNYKSNPILIDTDYDGIDDIRDDKPVDDNCFKSQLYTEVDDEEFISNVYYTVDYRNFFGNNQEYNQSLSTLSSIFASAAYDETRIDGMNKIEIMKYFGLDEVKQVKLSDHYTDQHISELIIGHRLVTYKGVTKDIVSIVIRGTNGTEKEWASNFDIGSDVEVDKDTGEKVEYDDWKNKNNHKGFDIAANRIMEYINDYLKSIDKDDAILWITGHSRGAAISNIIGANYEDLGYTTFTYTFATPNTTTDTKMYNSIFNIVNKDDLVPNLPMTEWGFNKYGKTVSVSIADKYEREWENLVYNGEKDYNPDTFGLQKTINSLAATEENRDGAYKYTCACHGDGTADNISIMNYGISEESREKAINNIPLYSKPYSQITRYNGTLVGGWDFKNCQTSAYFMQILAAVSSKALGALEFVALDVPTKFEDAKWKMICSKLGGVEHPHFVQSYYLLSKHITNSSFN